MPVNDIWLWQRLTSGDAAVDDESLIDSLAALAALPMRARAAFLPALVTLAESSDPRIRACAIAGLAGCRGVRGLAAIVCALDDTEPAVWQAACEALAVTGAAVPARLAHALFHRRAEVRRHLLGRGLPLAAAHLGAYLRGDPECRDLAATSPWPQSSLALAVELYEDGAIEAAELNDRIAAEQPAVVVELAKRRVGRSDATVADFLERPVGPPPGIDVLDAIAAALSEHPHRGAASVIADAVFGTNTPPSIGLRFAVAALAGPRIAEHALELTVALVPRLIARPEIATRDNAPVIAAGFRRHARRMAPIRSRPLRRLIERCPAIGRGDELDLDLAASLAALLPDDRLETLQQTFGDDAITAAIERSDRAWLSVCELPRGNRPQWRRWLDAVAARDSSRASELLALALWAWVRHRDRLDREVRELARPDRALALIALARLADAARVELAPDRLSVLVELIAARVIPSMAINTLVELCELDTAGGRLIAAALAREVPPRRLVSAAEKLDGEVLGRFLEHIDVERLPWNRELALAKTLASHPFDPVRGWAEGVLATLEADAPEADTTVPTRARALTDAERDAISATSEPGLDAALEPALKAPSLGLVAALERRVAPEQPHVGATTALVAAFDPLDKVALQLDRFASLDPDFFERLNGAVARWRRCEELPPLAHALLFRWEYHNFAMASWIEGRGGLLGRLHEIIAMQGDVARYILWRGVAEVVVLLRYRDRARLEPLIDHRVLSLLIGQLGTPVGRHAARALVAIFESRLAPIPLSAVREAIADKAADADQVTRSHLARLMRMDGLPPPASADAPILGLRDRIEAIKSETDLDALEEACRAPALRLVEEAVLRLLMLGPQTRDAGEARLAKLAGEIELLPCPAPIVASIEMWSSAAALDAVRALTRAPSAEIRMRVGLALAARGEPGMIDVAIEAARAPAAAGATWFGSEDWEALAQKVDNDRLALALIDSPHHRAYRPAFAVLITADPRPEIRDALIRFLEAGTGRPIGLRRTAARTLLATWSNPIGMPVVLEEYTDPNGSNLDLGELPRSEHLDRFVEAVVWMSLTGGHEACVEGRAVDALRGSRLGKAAESLWTALLEGSLQNTTRQTAAQMLTAVTARHAREADDKRRRVAESFAWGVRRGRELTGRLYRVHMTAAERAFGHTYLDEDRVFVSALPILRNERNGRDIVEGLILHELGHHVFHRGKRAAEIWKIAADSGLFSLLNLIADEHLERNLRALDTRFGDRLKRLGAYAFRHAAQEIRLSPLLDSLGSRAAEALIASPLDLAYDEQSVRINRGAILAQLDAGGHPLARFARALRLGLGNRDGIPLIEEALSRFGKSFRQLDMEGLWQLTLEIAELFGGRVAVAEVFGGSEGITWSERDGEVFGAGISDDDLQKEVERILDPRQARGHSGGGGKLVINVNPDEAFDRITNIVRLTQDRERHRQQVSEVRRHAARLRAYLSDLGLQYITVGKRVSGRHLDRTRIRALVTRADPRILRTRQLRTENDLYFGVAVDCSSSMQVGDNIGRAQRFGVLLAEAVRGLQGIDSRFIGFTDSTIFDAGDAGFCAVSSLPCGGGNNDAAALWHLSEDAKRSPRRAKVLVMISDGLPTQCSVSALRALVIKLNHQRLICAQVAVRQLEEICFPDHVLLEGGEVDAAVARFGRMVGDLARRALGA